jgi:hypothetical protein
MADVKTNRKALGLGPEFVSANERWRFSMKHKIWFLSGVALITAILTGCSVEMKDKNAGGEEKVTTAANPDYVIDGPLTLDGHQKIEVDRLVLTHNAVITTLDHSLLIVAREIVSDGAVIQNFPIGTTADWEKNGRSGGTIQITAQTAKGHLQVNLVGESGGAGLDGCIVPTWTTPPGCNGSNGGSGGNSGTLRAEIADSSNFNLNWENVEGKIGLGGRTGAIACPNPQVRAVHPPCYPEPLAKDGQTSGLKGQICMKSGTEDGFRCQ